MVKSVIKRLVPQGNLANRLYAKLYHFALWGMNFNQYENFEVSGEQSLMKYLKKSIQRNNPVLFDVGANKGSYTKLLRKHFTGNAKIYSFEPIKETFNVLRENTQHLTDVRLYNIGFSSMNEKREIFYQKGRSSQASLVKNASQHKVSEVVELRTLDSFCPEHGLEEIDFLKIDVEGFELKVFEGAVNLIQSRKIHFIQFEFGITQIHARVFFKDIWDALNRDYHIYRILRNSLFLLPVYHENLEIFHFSNYLAIRK